MSRLSITAAAREAGDAIAIITATRALTFAECARLAEAPPRAIVAQPAVATILAVYGALEAKRPLGLVHAKLPAEHRAAQLARLERAELPDGTAVVLFTSGSTGAAKGVILSRDAILAAAAASAAQLGWRDDDRWLSCLPMAHSGGLSINVRCLVARRPVVLHEGDFDAGAVRALAETARATLASLVPAQLVALAGTGSGAGARAGGPGFSPPNGGPPPSLRAIILGGAAAPPALVADAVARGWPVLPSYGLTETFGQIATARAPGGPLVALPGVTIAARETLRVRGPMLATAYLDGVFPIRYETTNAVAQAVAIAQVYGLGDDYYTRYREHIRAVTADDVLRAAQTFLHPERLLTVAVGDAAAIRAPMEKLGVGVVRVHEAPAENGMPG